MSHRAQETRSKSKRPAKILGSLETEEVSIVTTVSIRFCYGAVKMF